jgi:DNA-binding transcriptional ArsR family regulator
VPDPPPVPARDIRDPKALRAVAHPLRIRLLEEVALGGPMTATELAELVGESPANCSWHLRQLARYGFVEEAESGPGRRRRWRLVLRENRWSDAETDEELRRAGIAASEVVFAREQEVLRGYLARASTEPAAWQEAAFVAQTAGWLTAEELDRIGKEIAPILMRYIHRLDDPGQRPVGSRPVRFVAWGIPARPASPDKGDVS